jgi:dynein intermediate chain 1
LTADELKADITRVLTGDDPNRPKNIVKFSHKDQCFKLDPPGLADHMAVHYVRDGCSLHIDSKEYKGQKQRENLKKEAEEKQRKALDEGTSSSASITLCKEKTKNQFNFSDRSTQTLNNQLKTIYVGTEPPPVAQYSANVSQSQIYDHYVSELMMANMGHVENGLEQNHIDNNEEEDEEEDDDGSSCSENDEDFGIRSDDMVKALKIVERLVNQNSQDEMYQDFKYWEDASDQYRRGEGSLLPLWRFVYERTRRKQVTSLCWNPRNSDLFAVGYGSYNFLQQESGLVCCFSLKNTSYPEYIFPTESGVLSLDFNSEHPSLLAIGCYDGNVHVYDVASSSTKPIYSSTISTGQHKDPVWQVHWEKEELGENLNFYSISSDGNVFNWSMSKNELKMEPVIQLKFIPLAKNDSEEMAITGLASGCCFDFNRKHDHLFLVGTEEGNIYKCSKSYSGQYLQTYSGHHMAVYAVQWNSFDDDIFISCSADWTVKVSLQDLDFVLFDCSCAYLQLYFVLAMGPYNRLSSLITGSWQRSGRRDLVSLLVHNFLGSDE